MNNRLPHERNKTGIVLVCCSCQFSSTYPHSCAHFRTTIQLENLEPNISYCRSCCLWKISFAYNLTHLSPMQCNPPPHSTRTDTGYPKPPSWEPPLIVSWSVVNLPPFSPFWGHTDCLPRFQLGPSGTIQEVASSQTLPLNPALGWDKILVLVSPPLKRLFLITDSLTTKIINSLMLGCPSVQVERFRCGEAGLEQDIG